MVEGPGCMVKGEKLQQRAKGQVVKGVLGNAVDKHMKKKRKSAGDDTPVAVPPTQLSPYHVLLNHACTEVLTLGKELFMFFDGVSVCLRVHFLMAGGFRVNGENLDGDGGGEAKTASLILRMSKDVITFNKCSAEMRPAEESRSRVFGFRHLDICSSYFSHQRAVETMKMADGDRIVCDLLLDQLLLPGVGNIIKNEALFDSGIKPDTKLSALTETHISFMIKMTRDFSMIFYKCRRDTKPLQPYLKIYRKGKCGQCGGKTVTTRMGIDNARLTTYCPQCQANDINKAKNTKLPSKNSLLGWVATGVALPSPEWPCSMCTFINKSSSPSCSMCLNPRQTPSSPDSYVVQNTLSSATLNPPSTPHTTTVVTPRGKPLMGTTTRNNLNMVQPKGNNLENTTKGKGTQFPSSDSQVNHCKGMASLWVPGIGEEQRMHEEVERHSLRIPPPDEMGSSSKRARIVPPRSSPGQHQQQSAQVASQGQAVSPGVTKSIQRSCPTHRAPCMIREVRKENQNKHRMFFCCPTRQCNYFMWADEGFPLCENHGKRCVLRTVLKQGANNGRRFFACPQPKKKQCNTFQWADQYNHFTIR